MKKILSVLVAVVMVVAMLPIAATAETTENNGKMKVKIEGERMYVRTYHDETYDLVQTFRVNSDRIKDGIPANEPFDFHEAGLMVKNNDSFTSFDKQLAGGGDDVAPFKTNSSYIGANHGQSHAILVKATNHGKTYADLGARYTASGVYWNLLEIRDENNLLFISDNGRGDDYGKYFFEGVNKLPAGTVMTYESDGVDENSITVETATGYVWLLPATKKISVNMYAVTDGVKTLMKEADDLICDSIIVEEHYHIMNPSLVAQALRDNKPDDGYKENQSLDIGTAMIDYKVTYTILPDGAVLHVYDHEILDDLNFDFYGGHQYIAKWNGFGGSVKRYIPKLKPFTHEGKLYDFTEQYDLTAAGKDFLSGGEKWVTSDLWENPNSMPDRTVEYFYDKNDDLKASFVGGYLPILDAEPSTKVTKSSRAMYLYKSAKSYPILVDNLAFKETGTKNQHIRAVSYTKYNDVTDEDISYYTINYGTDTYIYIDCHEIAKKDITFEELGIRGNSLEIVEKSDNVKYFKGVDTISVDMRTGTYGYLVLKSDNSAYVSISDTKECKETTATTVSNGDLIFNAGSSATYDIGDSVPSGTYVVKANALATSNYTFSATVGDTTSSDTKSGDATLILGNFNFTNGEENSITISCTNGSAVTLDEIILEKISDIEILQNEKTEFSLYNDASIVKSNFKQGSKNTVAQAFENGLDYNRTGSGYGVFDEAGHYATYFVNVKESGLYDLSFITGRTDAEYIISVDDTKYIGSSDNSEKASLGTADENLEAYSDFVCGLYLTEGKHEIKVELKSGSAYLYAGILERVTDGIEVSPEKENVISAVGKYNSAVYNNTLEVYPDSGYATFRNGHKFYYLIDSAVKKDYTLYALTSGAQGSATVKDITNDKVLYTGAFGAVASGETKTEAGLVEIEKGKILLEITSTGETSNFYGFTLEPVSYKKVNAESTTEFSFYKDALSGEKNFGGGSDNTAAQAVEEGLEYDKEGSGYAVFNGANGARHYASYKFDVEEAGFYDITAVTGISSITFNITIDDKTYTGTANNSGKNSLGATSPHFAAYKASIKSVYLEKGTHKITFERTDGSGYAYAWFFERDLRKVNTEDEALIFAVTLNCDATYNGKLEVDTKGWSAVGGDFADYKDKGWVVFRSGHKFRYEIQTKRAGYYVFSPILGGNRGASAGKITNINTGEVLYNGVFGAQTDSVYTALKNECGTIYLDEGINAIEIESTSNLQYFYGFTLKCVEPEVTFTDADEKEITAVTDGAMKVSVNLGRIPYDDVYFAIYEAKDGKTVLYKLAKATVTDGVATATVSGISKKTGCTYSAKVFSWDAERLIGYSYSTEQ